MSRWLWLTLRVALRGARNGDNVGSASYDYLMFAGYVTMAYFWARRAQVSYEKLASGSSQADFYRAKIQTAEFYYKRLLPRANSHAKIMLANLDSVMQMPEEHFSFDY